MCLYYTNLRRSQQETTKYWCWSAFQVSLALNVVACAADAGQLHKILGAAGSGKSTWATRYVANHPEKHYALLGVDSIIKQLKVNTPALGPLPAESIGSFEVFTALLLLSAGTPVKYYYYSGSPISRWQSCCCLFQSITVLNLAAATLTLCSASDDLSVCVSGQQSDAWQAEAS